MAELEQTVAAEQPSSWAPIPTIVSNAALQRVVAALDEDDELGGPQVGANNAGARRLALAAVV